MLGLLLAAAGILLLCLVLLADEHGELGELEALGIATSDLRRQVRRAVIATGAAATAFAFAGAALLVGLIGELLEVSANAGRPQPPLRASLDLAACSAAAAAAAAASIALVLARTQRAFRELALGRLHG